MLDLLGRHRVPIGILKASCCNMIGCVQHGCGCMQHNGGLQCCMGAGTDQMSTKGCQCRASGFLAPCCKGVHLCVHIVTKRKLQVSVCNLQRQMLVSATLGASAHSCIILLPAGSRVCCMP